MQNYIGDLEPRQVHDQTLERFVQARLADGASATTINRSLEVVRTILNRAARSYRDLDGRPWLEGLPPLITMLPENPRSPYPITWQEQDALFRRLPPHLACMALFTINTGLRDSNVCGLQWEWEVKVPELGRSVFVIPAEAFKTKRPHVVILIKLTHPLFAGDTLYAESEVMDKRESSSRPGAGIVTVKTIGLNQDGKVVGTFNRTMLIAKRGHSVEDKVNY